MYIVRKGCQLGIGFDLFEKLFVLVHFINCNTVELVFQDRLIFYFFLHCAERNKVLASAGYKISYTFYALGVGKHRCQ